MATIIIHGTMPGASSPTSAKWWWDSWYEGGFLYHLAQEIKEISGRESDDVWKIRGVPVSQIPEMVENSWEKQFEKLSPLEKYYVEMGTMKLPESYRAHDGHYMWTGSFSHMLREQGGRTLARYLNRIKEIAPEEPIRIVAHSHGCNVVKMASSSELLDSSVHIDRAIFLACPHFKIKVGRGTKYPYSLDPSRFGKIFNLYSPTDKVQVDIAEDYPGPPDNFDFTVGQVTSKRKEQNPATQNAYSNFEIPTSDTKIKAHTVMHGWTVGAFCGILLSCQKNLFKGAYNLFKENSTPIPAGDVGE